MVKDVLISSTLDLILLLFPNTMAPILAYTKTHTQTHTHTQTKNKQTNNQTLAKLQEFLKPKYKKFTKMFKATHVRDQKTSLQH